MTWGAGKKYLILFCNFLSYDFIARFYCTSLKLSKVTVTLIRANIKFFLIAIFLYGNIFPMTSFGTVKHAHMVCLCTSIVIPLAMTLSEISNWISLKVWDQLQKYVGKIVQFSFHCLQSLIFSGWIPNVNTESYWIPASWSTAEDNICKAWKETSEKQSRYLWE